MMESERDRLNEIQVGRQWEGNKKAVRRDGELELGDERQKKHDAKSQVI